jgi:hypothetical protein
VIRTGIRLGGEGGGGEIHGPEHHSGGVEVDSAGVYDAKDFQSVQGEIARSHGHKKPRDAGETAGAGHVVEAGVGVEVMAAAAASADGGGVTVATVGKGMAANTDDKRRGHREARALRWSQMRMACGLLRTGRPLAFSSQLSAVSHQSVDPGRRYAFDNSNSIREEVTSAWLLCACRISCVKRNRGESGAVFPFWETGNSPQRHGGTENAGVKIKSSRRFVRMNRLLATGYASHQPRRVV